MNETCDRCGRPLKTVRFVVIDNPPRKAQPDALGYDCARTVADAIDGAYVLTEAAYVERTSLPYEPAAAVPRG